MDESFRTLHPLSPAINLVPRLWRSVRASWPLLLALWFGTGGRIEWFDLALLALPLGIAAVGSVVHWATLRYRVAGGRLEIETGLFQRQVRAVPLERIQHVRRVQRLLHRATGLVEVEIETASGTEVEGLLSALSARDADQLVAALAIAGPPAANADETQWYRSELPDLFLYGATGTRWGAALLLWGAVTEVAQWQDPERISQVSRALGPIGVTAAAVAVLTGTWLTGIAAAIARHWRFTLSERAGVVVARDGLLTRRRVELRPSKVQAVALLEPLLRRIAGYGTVVVETAAARSAAGGTERAQAVIPAVDDEQARELIARFVPGATPDGLVPPARGSLTVARIEALLEAFALALGLTALFGRWGLAALALVPLLFFLAEMDNRSQGYAATDATILSRRGWLRRETWVIARSKIQSVTLSDNPLLARAGLARVSVRVAGRMIALPVLRRPEAETLARGLARIP